MSYVGPKGPEGMSSRDETAAINPLLQSGWRPGPMPPGTYWWGGVVLKGDKPNGFYFCDFCGDHVKLVPNDRIVKGEDIALYNNSLTLPVEGGMRHGASSAKMHDINLT